MVQTINLLQIDAEKRRKGYRTGLETPLGLSVNDERWFR